MEQATPEVEQPTLEQLASEFKAEEKPPLQSGNSNALDTPPEDPEQLAKWSAERVKEVWQQQQYLREEISKKEQEEFVSGQMKALEDAVNTIGTDVPISKLLIEGALHAKYARDQNFRTIFDNRNQNPTAYKKALSVVADEIKKEAAVKYDPQVAEDARALNQLQRNARTGKTVDDPHEKWKGLSAAEFDRQWAKLRS